MPKSYTFRDFDSTASSFRRKLCPTYICLINYQKRRKHSSSNLNLCSLCFLSSTACKPLCNIVWLCIALVLHPSPTQCIEQKEGGLDIQTQWAKLKKHRGKQKKTFRSYLTRKNCLLNLNVLKYLTSGLMRALFIFSMGEKKNTIFRQQFFFPKKKLYKNTATWVSLAWEFTMRYTA